jgi:hypothetical protein
MCHGVTIACDDISPPPPAPARLVLPEDARDLAQASPPLGGAAAGAGAGAAAGGAAASPTPSPSPILASPGPSGNVSGNATAPSPSPGVAAGASAQAQAQALAQGNAQAVAQAIAQSGGQGAQSQAAAQVRQRCTLWAAPRLAPPLGLPRASIPAWGPWSLLYSCILLARLLQGPACSWPWPAGSRSPLHMNIIINAQPRRECRSCSCGPAASTSSGATPRHLPARLAASSPSCSALPLPRSMPRPLEILGPPRRVGAACCRQPCAWRAGSALQSQGLQLDHD